MSSRFAIYSEFYSTEKHEKLRYIFYEKQKNLSNFVYLKFPLKSFQIVLLYIEASAFSRSKIAFTIDEE